MSHSDETPQGAMTEKPNSVCKFEGCGANEEAWIHSEGIAYPFAHPFEPVAEPAEPPQPWPEPICKCSLRKSARVHDTKENGEPEMGCHKFESAEPSASFKALIELPGPTGEGSSGHSWVEPVSAEPTAELNAGPYLGLSNLPPEQMTAHSAAPQPVAGEGPIFSLNNAGGIAMRLRNHPDVPVNARVDIVEQVLEIIGYKASEGTPKLEERKGKK